MGHHIYLNNKQAALVLGESGYHALHIPKMKDEGLVPHYITLLTTIAILLKNEDKKFQQYVAKRFNEILGKSLSELENKK